SASTVGRAPWCARWLTASARSSSRCGIRGSSGASRGPPLVRQLGVQRERQPEWEEQRDGLGQLRHPEYARGASSLAVGHAKYRAFGSERTRTPFEASTPIEEPDETREPLGARIAVDVLEAPFTDLWGHEREVGGEHQPTEQFDVGGEFDRDVKHDTEPQREAAKTRQPHPERDRQFSADGGLRCQAREPGAGEDDEHPAWQRMPLAGDLFRRSGVTHEQHLPTPPIGVEQLARRGTEINERYLDLEQTARERGREALVARQRVLPSAHEQERAIARGEREQEGEQEQRVAVVVILQPITKQKIKTKARCAEQRLPRPDAEERAQRGERLQGQQ